jgi:hypothetical protein
MFPNLCVITRDLLDELKELMLHATCGQYSAITVVHNLNTTSDHLTTTRSAAALSADELKQYFEIVKWIRGSVPSTFPGHHGNMCMQWSYPSTEHIQWLS